MGEIIAIANQKGGVGKTTTVISLGAYLALAGRRVLVIDLDPQGNATSGLGVARDSVIDGSSYDLLATSRTAGDLARPTSIPTLTLIPSARDLAGLEVELVPLQGRERKLEAALADLPPDIDHVLVDCPPSLGLLTVNALTAADSVLVPIQCEYYALEGLTQLMSTIDLVRRNLNARLRLKGVVLTMFDGRTTLSADVLAEVRHHLGSQVFESVIPRSIRLAEAPGYGLPISLYSPASRGAAAYQALAAELLARDGVHRLASDAASPGGASPDWITTS